MAQSQVVERSAFAEALAGSWRQLCEGFERLLAQTRFEQPEQARDLQQLDRALHAQLALEEELMLPPFELEAHEQAELVRAEHQHLRGLLHLVEAELAQGGLNRKLADSLLRLLHEHVHHAQQLVHSWADHCLPYRAKVRILERQQALWHESGLSPGQHDAFHSGIYASSEPTVSSKG